MDSSELIQVNMYIIIQRQGFFKLHQLVNNSCVMLGKHKLNLTNLVGKPFWSLFKMVPSCGKRREFVLEECSKAENISVEIRKAVSYGTDNRNISDDGSSQSLSSEDINGMRDEGMPGHEILGKLVENSKTFKEKTEFSQDKYLKKKEKKYSEYIIIRKPTLRLLAEVLYSRDQLKIMGLRHDTLSQIFTAANIQHDGVYALYENGSQALVAAGVLSYLSNEGLLINLTLGSNPQKQAVLAMNFDKAKMSQLINVRIQELLKLVRPANDKAEVQIDASTSDVLNAPVDNTTEVVENKLPDEQTDLLRSRNSSDSTFSKIDSIQEDCKKPSEEDTNGSVCSGATQESAAGSKRKLSSDGSQISKRPRWAEDLDRGIAAFTTRKLNGVIIVAKEYPLNVIEELLPFLKPSSQLVVYSSFREPLVQLYIDLKKRKDVIGIHVTENWLRVYQVLPGRTHPAVNMSFTGHLLLATKVL